MTPIVMLGKEIFQPVSKELLRQLKKLGAKVIPKKEVTPAVKAKAKTVTKKNIVGLESDKYPKMIRKIPTGKPGISKKEMQRAVKEEPIKGKMSPGWYAKHGYVTKGQRRKMGETDLVGGELKQRPKVRKDGGQVVKKDTQVAAAWMKGLSQKEIDQILGKPTRDASGVKHSQKKKKSTKVRKAKVGGKVVTYRMTGGQVVDAGYD